MQLIYITAFIPANSVYGQDLVKRTLEHNAHDTQRTNFRLQANVMKAGFLPASPTQHLFHFCTGTFLGTNTSSTERGQQGRRVMWTEALKSPGRDHQHFSPFWTEPEFEFRSPEGRACQAIHGNNKCHIHCRQKFWEQKKSLEKRTGLWHFPQSKPAWPETHSGPLRTLVYLVVCIFGVLLSPKTRERDKRY